jgi:predicted cobalt transporter CbtA
MLATIIIEIGLLIYSLIRYKFTLVTKIVTLIIFSLAMFQVAEFQTCGRVLGQSGLMWSRLGYIFITLLPPRGLHLISAISKKKPTLLHWTADASALILVTIFGLLPSAIYVALCGGNYVIFKIHEGLGWVYGFYYLGFLFAGLVLAAQHMKTTKKNQYKALTWMIIGYLLFLIPTGVVNLIDPATIYGVPSIMCGFAVLYAIILAFKVLPRIVNHK